MLSHGVGDPLTMEALLVPHFSAERPEAFRDMSCMKAFNVKHLSPVGMGNENVCPVKKRSE